MTSMAAKLAEMGRDIKLAHSVFALPFALLATFLAADGMPRWGQLALIVVCMFFARTYAMLANRYVDRRIDAANPRTAGRALPAGRLKPRDVLIGLIVCAVALWLGAAAVGVVYGNWWPTAGAPVVLIWLGAYGFAKRHTELAHFVLGGALAMSPPAAALAIEPTYFAEPTVWLLAAFVLLWVAGFDIIYALQDLDFDREHGLRSVPAKLGHEGALWVARGAHLLGLLALVGVHRLTPAFRQGRIVPTSNVGYFLLGVVAVGLLLMVEHRAAREGRFTMAFFTLNGLISLALGALGIADVLVA